eukprot:m.204824 g.204824  ORF g.204824 m.204824 type:complete len:252 (+) comp13742_c0_seq19:3305-4060(+)
MGNRTGAQKAMKDACSRGFTHLRFAATGFWPSDMTTYMKNKHKHWELFDELVADAESCGCFLVPSIFWNTLTFSDLASEPLSMLFDRESKTFSLVSTYVKELVTRYAENTTIAVWEMGNEMNLIADLDLAQQQPSIAPSKGTPNTRTQADNFTTDMMIQHSKDIVQLIRQHDTKLNRPISSGFSIPRAQAEHLRHSYFKKNRDWGNDTLEQFQHNLMDIHQSFDCVSVHFYQGNNDRFNITDPHSAELLHI